MSEKQDVVVITIEDDSDDDVVIIEDSETEQDTSINDASAIEPRSQQDQPQFQMAHEVAGAVVPAGEVVPQMNTRESVKRHSSAEVEFSSLNKRRQLSVPGEDNMGSQEVIKGTKTQMNHLRGLISTLQHSWENSAMPKCQGDCPTKLPEERQAIQGLENPERMCLQPAACPDQQQLDFRIISTCSLLPCDEPENPTPDPTIVSCIFSGDAASSNTVDPSVQLVEAAPDILPPEDPIVANNHDEPSYLAGLGNKDTIVIEDTPSEYVCRPPSCDTPVIAIAEASLENNPEMMNCSPLMGNASDQPSSSSCAISPPDSAFEKVILIEVPRKAEINMEGCNQTIYYPAFLGNIVASDPETSSASNTCTFVVEKVILIEMPVNAEHFLEHNLEIMINPAALGIDGGQGLNSSYLFIPSTCEIMKNNNLEMNPQMIHNLPVENANSQGTSSSLFILPSSVQENVLPIGMVETEVGPEMTSVAVNCLPLMENGRGQNNNSAYPAMAPGLAYLGDPRRKIMIHKVNLIMALKKSKPKYAACYLVRVLFSKEALLRGFVGDNCLGRQPLDPNKIAAIREYLVTIFPQCDLRECGKAWRVCTYGINSLIRGLCLEAKTPFNRTSGTNRDSANLNALPSASWNAGQDDDAGEGTSQQMRTYKTREIENPGNTRHKNTKNVAISPEAMGYFGNPSRNIQIPYEVMNKAKSKFRPDLAARFLVRHLFTDEVLIRSNVYGSYGYGMCALNANRIGALREFLQDSYPSCDLVENGRDWKLCVTAINSCIRCLRYDLRRSIINSQMSSAATPPSTNSEPRDPDVTNSST